ncbi:uncharacterized protein LOC126972016 isoform X2 [Leptidea sinapis]|uniref:uncharacterized protein LOC126972016 isoform X2 n=1 Tax=Leptidea sinapis TaxID=189913 RepID=UPI0021C4508E|nr:uncharacterized protein LOC126972016 isoform X2 [Leptidea sinapis]
MELVSFIKGLLHNVAEYAASYRVGQSVLRYADKALWTVEKGARWAVPPPLDQDDRPQPELIRPLPWLFFLLMLIALRIVREVISLCNLAFGKPPFRSADMVTYIQGKRRYLRTLKYQGNRIMRARYEPSRESWRSSLYSLFEFTMCFRRQHCTNNNTTLLSNNDEVLIVKRTKSGRSGQSAVTSPLTSPVTSCSETSMERLIEKMMVDLDADSDDSNSYALTNGTSARSSETESDHEGNVTSINTTAMNTLNKTITNITDKDEIHTSTPHKSHSHLGDELSAIADPSYDTVNFLYHERNGQSSCKIENGGPTYSPVTERVEAELIH